MSRRQFIRLLGGAAAWPLAARAQPAGKMPTIGFLCSNTPETQGPWNAAFVQRLRELGWIEGRNLTIEYRWAEGRYDRYEEIAAEFVRMKVNIILTSGTAPVIAAKKATSTIPIVFAAAGNPVATGLVASLSRPSGNVTGLSNQQAELAAKRLALLREIMPGLHRLAAVVNVDSAAAMSEMRDLQTVAHSLGIDVQAFEIRSAEEIAPAFNSPEIHGVEALYVVSDPLMSSYRSQLNILALTAKLPTMYAFRGYVSAGGLLSYGANYPDLFRRAADYVNKILRGTAPGNIPVEQPTRFDLIVNLTTAKALGINIPPTLLSTADEVIE